MKVYKMVFSPTGGTEKVADLVAKGLGTEIETIDLSAQNFSGCELTADGVAVIAMPSFGGRAPQVAIDRLKTVKANGTKAVVIAVYGNRAQEDTLIEMKDIAAACGFNIAAGIAAVAEHSIAHQYGAGRPDDPDSEQLTRFARRIAEKINGAEQAAPAIPGDHPYKKAGAGLLPKATSACVKCGVCVTKCPVGAIDTNDPTKTDKNTCINCMRCVSVCPKNARKASGFMVKLVGIALKKDCSARKENVLYI